MSRYQVCLNAFTIAEDDCGQCEGTGTTDAMGYEEECPVCDGSGTLPGDETYTDDLDEAVGWSVYVRTEPDEGGQFEVPEEHDVSTHAEAITLADRLARQYGTSDIREF